MPRWANDRQKFRDRDIRPNKQKIVSMMRQPPAIDRMTEEDFSEKVPRGVVGIVQSRRGGAHCSTSGR